MLNNICMSDQVVSHLQVHFISNFVTMTRQMLFIYCHGKVGKSADIHGM